MKNMYAVILLLVIVVGAIYLSGLREKMVLPESSGFSYAGLRVGQAAPKFEVAKIDGEKLNLADLKKPALIIFSATWCPSCKETLDAAKNVYPRYEDNVSLISIGIDFSEPADTIAKYRDSNGYPGIFAIGNKEVMLDYKVSSTATNYGIKDGFIVYSDIGAIDEKEMEDILKRLA